VKVGSESVTFTLANNGGTFTVPLYQLMTITGGTSKDSINIFTSGTPQTLTVTLPAGLAEADYTSILAEAKSVSGTGIDLKTRSAATDTTWGVTITNPDFTKSPATATATVTPPTTWTADNLTALLVITLTKKDGTMVTASRTLKVPALPLVGDIYYSDGSWSSTYDANKTPIGVVVSTNPDYCEKDQGYGHGLVMALKNASTGITDTYQWKKTRDASGVLTYKNSLKKMYEDVSGKSNTDAIGTTKDTYPAFQAIGSYKPAVPAAPAGTSGWFLPSMGQWWDVLEKVTAYNNTSLGISSKHIENSEDLYFTTGEGTIAVSALNNVLSKNSLSPTLYDSFAAGMLFWTSSEYSASSACYLKFNAGGNLVLGYLRKTDPSCVRPFLAF